MKKLDVEELADLSEFGFVGGWQALAPFAAKVHSEGAPRFLRTGENDLVVYRNADLQALGAAEPVGDVPPLVLFGTAYAALEAGRPVLGSALASVISNQIFSTNAPIHKPLRKVLVAQLGPKQVKAMEETACKVAQSILDEIDFSGPVDGLSHFSERATCRFWGALLGMNDAEIRKMEALIHDFTPIFFINRTMADVERFDGAAGQYEQLLESVAQRGLAQGNPLIGALANGIEAVRAMDFPEDAGSIGILPRSAGAMLAGNLVDGYHTAAVAITNILYILSQNMDVVAQISHDRSLMLPAIFEALRIAPPVLALKRLAMDDFVYDGIQIPKGTSLVMMWGVGGYDPAVFPHPQQFRLDRTRQGSTVFGGGAHICPGRYLAPMLAKKVVGAILDRNLLFQADPTKTSWYEGTLLSQLRQFELHFSHAK